MRKLQTVLAHLNVMFAGVFLTLWVINLINPAMHFLASGVTNLFLVLFCLSAMALGILNIMAVRRRRRMEYERALASHRARRDGQAPVRPPRR